MHEHYDVGTFHPDVIETLSQEGTDRTIMLNELADGIHNR